jgi:DNA-binding transcriptional LysR family regulator
LIASIGKSYRFAGMTADLDALLVFDVVAREGSFTRAASALGVSQPSISERMQRLEQRLGTPVFIRRGRGVALTVTGLALRSLAARANNLAREADEFVTGLTGLDRGLIRGAASTTIAGYVLPAAIARLRAARPGVEIDLAVGNTLEMAEMVERGDVGWALVEGPVEEARLAVRRFRDDELILIVAASHPWARRRRPIVPASLVDEPFIAREPGSGTGAVIERALVAVGIQLVPRVRIADSRGIAEAVAAGAGVGIISELVAAPLLASGAVVRVAVTGLSLVRPLSLVHLPGRTLGRLDRELLRFIP